jgi:predicted transcriptional regulator
MRDLYEFREKGNLTFAMIIIELLKGKGKLREISKDLKMTPQGVSVYLKNLQKLRYIDSNNVPTQKGVGFLQQILATLSLFVEDAYEDTGIISSCEAIAGEKLRKGDRVNLLMRRGLLFAYKKTKSGSIGTVDFNVDEGEPVRISSIEGIIDHKVGNFFVLPIDFKDSTDSKMERLNRLIKEREIEFVGAYGILSTEVCKRAGIKASVFAPVEGCIEAGAKGLNSLLIYSPEMARFFFQKISANIHKYKINPKFVEI